MSTHAGRVIVKGGALGKTRGRLLSDLGPRDFAMSCDAKNADPGRRRKNLQVGLYGVLVHSVGGRWRDS